MVDEVSLGGVVSSGVGELVVVHAVGVEKVGLQPVVDCLVTIVLLAPVEDHIYHYCYYYYYYYDPPSPLGVENVKIRENSENQGTLYKPF